MVVDLVQRFSPTPLVAILRLNGISARVATNDQLLLDRFRVESTDLVEGCRKTPTAHWRIVVEVDAAAASGEFALHSFEHDGLSFTRIAERSFLAFDRQTQSGISFVNSALIQEERLFSKYFLPAFVSILEGMKGEKWNAS